MLCKIGSQMSSVDAVSVFFIIIIIFVYLIADIPRNLTLLTYTTQGGTDNSRHAGQRYIQKG